MTTTETPRFFTVEEAAVVARRSPKALRDLRHRGLGPRFRKVDGRLLVSAADLEVWLAGEGAEGETA